MAATTDRHTRHNPSHPQTLAGPRVSPAAHRFVNFTHNRHCGPPPASNITTGDLQNAPAPASYSHRHLATLLNHDPAEMPRLFGGFGIRQRAQAHNGERGLKILGYAVTAVRSRESQCSKLSERANQLASMTFSDEPTVLQVRWPSVDSIRTRTTEPVPLPWSTTRTL